MGRTPDASLVSLSEYTKTPLTERRFCLCVICWACWGRDQVVTFARISCSLCVFIGTAGVQRQFSIRKIGRWSKSNTSSRVWAGVWAVRLCQKPETKKPRIIRALSYKDGGGDGLYKRIQRTRCQSWLLVFGRGVDWEQIGLSQFQTAGDQLQAKVEHVSEVGMVVHFTGRELLDLFGGDESAADRAGCIERGITARCDQATGSGTRL